MDVDGNGYPGMCLCLCVCLHTSCVLCVCVYVCVCVCLVSITVVPYKVIDKLDLGPHEDVLRRYFLLYEKYAVLTKLNLQLTAALKHS